MLSRIQVRALVIAFVVGTTAGCASTLSSTRSSPADVGAAIDSGQLGDAPYRVEIPESWNGELVMLLHGYEPRGVPRESPWPQNDASPIFLSQGYAVAESAYTSQGWSVRDALPDNEQLRSYFADKHAEPNRTYLVGFSLGGHIALASLEKYGERYYGALSLCGVNVPTSIAFEEGILTSLVSFDYFFPGAMGLAPGGLSDPASPPMLDPEAIEAVLAGNEAAATILVNRLEIPRAGLAGALMLNYMVLREAQTRSDGFPADNMAVSYVGFGDDAAFNRGVRRYAGDRRALGSLAGIADLTGRFDKPVVIQSNNNDPTVPKRFESIYPALAFAADPAAPLVSLPSVGEGHCDFTPDQIQAAFGTLTHWVKSGTRPDSLQTGR
ncbi:hypothetical protein WCE37_14640 [Luteimonas sp. MJ250]|uniref:hypothetical protein n=1 Tax=Luteimonas sp. MJ250 TaxID=3129236 RepID=UPI0031BACDEC